MEQQLAENPPADHLVQFYFRANKWWDPPSRSEIGGDSEEDEVWECPLPDVTE